jgi:hypothetical protein
MIDCQRDIIDAQVKRGIGSAVRSHDVQPQDRASWTADLQAEMDAAIATNHLSSVRVQLRSLTSAHSGVTVHSLVGTSFRSAHPGRRSR